MRYLIILVLISFSAYGAFSAFHPPLENTATTSSGYTYIPIDPFPVKTVAASSCEVRPTFLPSRSESLLTPYKPLLASFPDNTIRMSQERITSSGQITYGPSVGGSENDTYRVTFDYINADTTNFEVLIAKRVINELGGTEIISIFQQPSATQTFDRYLVERLELPHDDPSDNPEDLKRREIYVEERRINLEDQGYEKFNIPIYIGIGLRVTAHLMSSERNTTISGLGSLAAEVEAERVSGTLVMQTLGISGKLISAAMPVQSDLNQTAVQNAFHSIAAMRMGIYDGATTTSPRLVGFYLPFPGDQSLVNALISQLSAEPRQEWHRPCENKLTDR